MKRRNQMHKDQRRGFQVESQIMQGFVNQEKEFGFYFKEALLRAMRSRLSQKTAAEVETILKGVRW